MRRCASHCISGQTKMPRQGEPMRPHIKFPGSVFAVLAVCLLLTACAAVINLLELAAGILVHPAVAREDVQFLQQRYGLGRLYVVHIIHK